ncbi:uncharacterized protein LOC135214451 isoform X1 [Macrobrachium nipponense]|uniref:uncharacterized protein LOC135214451 isoform X1 n=1 Tax=Macrobrachium nipponense TaxID=159736 RepID=UPI0030C8553D
MEGIYRYQDTEEAETQSSSLFVQRAEAVSVKEGELTDEYIVNLMHEYVNSQPEFDLFHLLKISDAKSGVLDITREMTPQWWDTRDHGSGSPAIVPTLEVPEELTDPQPSVSPYATINYLSPEGVYAEEEIANSPRLTFSDSHMSEHHLKPFPDQSHCRMTRPRSPSGIYEDLTQAESSSEVPSHSLPLPTPIFAGDNFVSHESQDPPKKKRGRKPKSEAEKAAALEQRQAKRSRVRVYEVEKPYEDKEMERKRINAINSKKHRDQEKQLKKEMEKQFADTAIERDILKQQNEELQRKLDAALQKVSDTANERNILKQENGQLRRKLDVALKQLEAFKKQYGFPSVLT